MHTADKGATLSLCVYAAILLAYPLLFICGTSFDIKLFTPSTMSAIALAAILWTPGRLASSLASNGLFPSLPIAALALITALHFGFDPRWKFEDLCLGLSWLAFPAFTWINADAVKKTLPPFLALLWLANICLSLLDFHFGRSLSGLPGNWNWNIALSLMCSPFAALCAWKVLKRGEDGKWLALGVSGVLAVVLATAWLFWQCDSRAALLSLLAVAGLLPLLELEGKWRKLYMACALAMALAVGALISLKGVDATARFIAKDVRIPLWESAVSFIADHPLTGVGEASFESEFAPYRSIEYFLNPTASVRTNHPHNNLLFIAAGFGIPGLLAWLALLVYPMAFFAVSYRRRSLLEKLFFFAFVSIITHAMFDLVLYEWPTAMAALLILGVLWACAWPRAGDENAWDFKGAQLLKWTAKLSALAVALAACLAAGLCAFAHWNSLKTASLKSDDGQLAPVSAYYADRAAGVSRTTHMILYRAMTNAFLNAKNSDLALHHIEQLDQTPYWNFAHVNGFRAKCLTMKGLFREAEPYALRECENYPLQVLPLLALTGIYRKSGQTEKAIATEKALETVMKFRGLGPDDLKTILASPDQDLHFNKPGGNAE